MLAENNYREIRIYSTFSNRSILFELPVGFVDLYVLVRKIVQLLLARAIIT